MEKRGRTRDKKLSDYFMTEEDKNMVMDFLSGDDPDKETILKTAATSANDQIARFLYKSLLENKSYESISKKEFIPIGMNDFYGYRRKTIYKVYELMIMNLKAK